MQIKRIWEIEELFHCPLVGMCLTIPQQKQILKRGGIEEKMTEEYTVHATLIRKVREKSQIATRFETQLNRKYHREISEWQSIPPEEWMPFFCQTLNPGTAGALLWLSTAYLDLSCHQRMLVYGEIHMLGFHAFQGRSRLLKKVEMVEKQRSALQDRYQSLRSHFKNERKMLKEREQQYISRQRELEALLSDTLQVQPSQPQSSADLQAECTMLNEKLLRMEKKLHTREIAAEKLKSERDRFKQQFLEHQQLVEDMQGELAKIMEHFSLVTSQADHCPNAALCNRRVLIVGGMTKLRSFYEQIVTKMGGQFEYHDGYKYNGVEGLSRLVDRSDVVICPVDVNSHSACLHVKKCCKELNKPYYMLRSSSVSTIHQTLTEVAALGN